MFVGLTAAHRSGKTTLAKEFVKKNPQFTFAPTSTSAIMKMHGFDPAKDYPLEERLKIQNIILDELDSLYSQFKKDTIFDRTPLDAAAYMLADVQRENVPSHLQAEVAKYVERCIDITNRRFAMILFIPPVIELKEEEGKAPAQPAYVAHISHLIDGLRNDERMRVRSYTMPRANTDIETRVLSLEIAVSRVMGRFVEEREIAGLTDRDLH